MAWKTLAEAAKFFRCSSRTMWRRIKKGTLISKPSNGVRMVWIIEEEVHTVSSHKPSIPKERYVMRLLELFEGLFIVRMRFEGQLEMAEFLDYASPPSSQGKASEFHKNCRFFFEHLDTCFRQVDQLLNTFDLDQTVILTIYRTLVILNTHWQASGLHLHEEQMEEKGKGSSDTLAIFNHMLNQVRMLLLLCAQQSSTETESHAVMVQKGIMDVETRSRTDSQDDRVSHPQIDKAVSNASSRSQKTPSPQKESKSCE